MTVSTTELERLQALVTEWKKEATQIPAKALDQIVKQMEEISELKGTVEILGETNKKLREEIAVIKDHKAWLLANADTAAAWGWEWADSDTGERLWEYVERRMVEEIASLDAPVARSSAEEEEAA